MRRSLAPLAVVFAAAASIGCSIEIEKTLVMQEGSYMDLFFETYDEPPRQAFMDDFALDGGTVMVISVSTSIFDYLNGTVEGDVDVTELLFTGDDLLIIFPLGPVCVGLGGPSGGTFEYDVLAETARFDVLVNTLGTLLDPTYAAILGGGFPFPFDLEAEMPLSLVEAAGLFTGTGDLEVNQMVDARFTIGQGKPPVKAHVVGEVTLKTEDAFPSSPEIEGCIERFAEGI